MRNWRTSPIFYRIMGILKMWFPQLWRRQSRTLNVRNVLDRQNVRFQFAYHTSVQFRISLKKNFRHWSRNALVLLGCALCLNQDLRCKQLRRTNSQSQWIATWFINLRASVVTGILGERLRGWKFASTNTYPKSCNEPSQQKVLQKGVTSQANTATMHLQLRGTY